jgi:membrane-bound lytic murein transglycosylase F
MAAVCLLGFAGAACGSLFQNELEAIRQRGTLQVLTRNAATCYYRGAHGYEGFEYDLAKAFARHLGVRLQPVVVDTLGEMVTRLIRGEADLIASDLVVTPALKKRVVFGPAYRKVRQLVIGRRGAPRLAALADLDGRPIWVKAGSAQQGLLEQLRRERGEIGLMTVSGYETEELLEMVWQKIIPLTVAESNVVALNRRYYPELLVHLDLQADCEVAWALAPANLQLRKALHRWFARPETQALLKRLDQHYYGHLETFDYVDLVKFRSRIQTRLPQFIPFFQVAAEESGFNWLLLAAQAYQESHWDPKAKSFTGVRGMMMLTLETASDLGVSNRLDAQQSITAGGRYLADLHRRIDPAVPEPDRTYMALAAYNVGFGHLQDARLLAGRLGKAANTWPGVRDTLPLLRHRKYYRDLTYGFARGDEPVRYVDAIRTYHKVLAQQLARLAARQPIERREVISTGHGDTQ